MFLLLMTRMETPKYIISIGRDITARKQVEKELRIAKEKAEYINEAKNRVSYEYIRMILEHPMKRNKWV